MKKYYFLSAIILFSSTGYSQKRYGRHLRTEGFAIKTDFLSLFNSIVDKDSKSGYLTGEIYFNDDYSLNVDAGAESLKLSGYKRMAQRFGSQFRWYLMQDECNCSAFFVGSYLSFEKVRQSVDHNSMNSIPVSYTTSYLEGGFSGGFQALLANHFVIDPTVQIGLKFPHNIHYIESMRTEPDESVNELLIRILLGVGYRF